MATKNQQKKQQRKQREWAKQRKQHASRPAPKQCKQDTSRHAPGPRKYSQMDQLKRFARKDRPEIANDPDLYTFEVDSPTVVRLATCTPPSTFTAVSDAGLVTFAHPISVLGIYIWNVTWVRTPGALICELMSAKDPVADPDTQTMTLALPPIQQGGNQYQCTDPVTGLMGLLHKELAAQDTDGWEGLGTSHFEATLASDLLDIIERRANTLEATSFTTAFDAGTVMFERPVELQGRTCWGVTWSGLGRDNPWGIRRHGVVHIFHDSPRGLDTLFPQRTSVNLLVGEHTYRTNTEKAAEAAFVAALHGALFEERIHRI